MLKRWLFVVVIVASVLAATVSALSLVRWCCVIDNAVKGTTAKSSTSCAVASDRSKKCVLECDDEANCTVQREEDSVAQGLECLMQNMSEE